MKVLLLASLLVGAAATEAAAPAPPPSPDYTKCDRVFLRVTPPPDLPKGFKVLIPALVCPDVEV